MAKRTHTGTPATAQLTALGINFELLEYAHDPHCTNYGDEAATALGVPPEQIFKTLIVAVDHSLTVAVVPVSGSLNLKAFAAASGGKKAALAAADVAERKSGYVLGGVSPIGQRTPLRTLIDVSAQQHEWVLVSAGRRGSDLRIAPIDLARVTGATWAAIART